MDHKQAVKVALDIDEFIGKKEFLDASVQFRIGKEKGSVVIIEPEDGTATYIMEADFIDISKIRRIMLQLGWRTHSYEGTDMEPIWKGF
ncbi:MAG: hypothetical protein FWC15_02985 [Fibromonadales bacterium]|nr:hypothetical protein [Fibromonadales bacterium]